ncbi:hypothetical protein [Lichenihabitans psoromatis]|uniref:hypothetical protein n=1 Tax=Lichenihabitans psoromatis TaxID=2528642 RepID=UPI0010383912|nr:hypothetical protein [Lichenihabitans psoromatis]
MTYAHVFARILADTPAHDQAERTTERMSRDLLHAAVHERADLGDWRTIDSVLLAAGFTRGSIDLYGVSALERARFKRQFRARVVTGLEAFGFAFLVAVALVIYCIVCPLPARAAATVVVDPSIFASSVVPILLGVMLLGALIWAVATRGTPWIADAPESDQHLFGETTTYTGDDR